MELGQQAPEHPVPRAADPAELSVTEKRAIFLSKIEEEAQAVESSVSGQRRKLSAAAALGQRASQADETPTRSPCQPAGKRIINLFRESDDDEDDFPGSSGARQAAGLVASHAAIPSSAIRPRQILALPLPRLAISTGTQTEDALQRGRLVSGASTPASSFCSQHGGIDGPSSTLSHSTAGHEWQLSYQHDLLAAYAMQVGAMRCRQLHKS